MSDADANEPESHLDIGAQDRFDDLKRRAAGLESTIDAHIEDAERAARERAAEIVADAELQAKSVRADAQAMVESARTQMNELMRLRQALFASLRDTLNDFEDAISQAEENRSFTEPAQVAAPPVEPVPEPVAPPDPADEKPPPEPEEETPIDPAVPSVEVRVEPLKDLRAARAVEGAFETLPVGQGVHLRSFENRTALLEASGVDVNILLGSMRAHFPVPFILRDASPGKLVVQVGEITGTGA